jgi:hypothetical protein
VTDDFTQSAIPVYKRAEWDYDGVKDGLKVHVHINAIYVYRSAYVDAEKYINTYPRTTNIFV